MSHRLGPVTALAVAMAVMLSAPAEAKDITIIEGPVKADDLDCKSCVKRKALRNKAVSTGKIKNEAVSNAKIQDGAVTADKLAPELLDLLNATQSTFYITLDGDGATETIATNGPLTYFARCLVEQEDGQETFYLFDKVEIVATSSVDGWFEEERSDNSGGTKPFEAGQEIIAEFRTVSPSGGSLYASLSETSIVAPDGSYLGLEGDAGGMGLNIFGHDCIVMGNIYSFTGAP